MIKKKEKFLKSRESNLSKQNLSDLLQHLAEEIGEYKGSPYESNNKVSRQRRQAKPGKAEPVGQSLAA